jgi:hypothetical protein
LTTIRLTLDHLATTTGDETWDTATADSVRDALDSARTLSTMV